MKTNKVFLLAACFAAVALADYDELKEFEDDVEIAVPAVHDTPEVEVTEEFSSENADDETKKEAKERYAKAQRLQPMTFTDPAHSNSDPVVC